MPRHAERTPAPVSVSGCTVIDMTSRRPGRRSKGERKPSMVRFPLEHVAIYEEAAARAGLPLSDYVAREMALRHGLNLPEYLTATDQTQLPLAEAS
jgi:hypothetical protein